MALVATGIPMMVIPQKGTAYGNIPFDHAPACAKGRIARRQGPDAVQMIGQQHPAVNGKGMGAPHPADGLAQGGTDWCVTQKTMPLVSHQGKEIGAPRRSRPSVVRHNQATCPLRLLVHSATDNTIPQGASHAPFPSRCPYPTVRSAHPTLSSTAVILLNPHPGL